MSYYDTNEGILIASTLSDLSTLSALLVAEGVALDTELSHMVVIKVEMGDDALVPNLNVSLDDRPEKPMEVKVEESELPVGPAGTCIKTGCTAYVDGMIWHGDLFDLGEVLMLNCNVRGWVPSAAERDMTTFHLWAASWENSLQDGKVLLLNRDQVEHYTYDGHPWDYFTKKPEPVEVKSPLADCKILYLCEGERITEEMVKEFGYPKHRIGQKLWDLSDGPPGARGYSEPFTSVSLAVVNAVSKYPDAVLFVEVSKPDS